SPLLSHQRVMNVRRSLRKNRQWVNLRRVQHEGVRRAFSRWRLWARILQAEPVVVEPVSEQSPVEIHLLCCERDYLTAMWALKSFYKFSDVRFPLAIHVQGRATRLL